MTVLSSIGKIGTGSLSPDPRASPQMGKVELKNLGFEPYPCDSEEEARGRAAELIDRKKWPVYFFASDTTGEKDFEEFFIEGQDLDLDRFETIGVIHNPADYDSALLEHFLSEITRIRSQPTWNKPELVALFNRMIPEFQHKETGKYLDSRM